MVIRTDISYVTNNQGKTIMSTTTMAKPVHTKKFYFGVFLIITNFIVGKIAIPFFMVNVWLGAGIYLFSWLMLIAGLILSGREGWQMAKYYYKRWKHNLAENVKDKYPHKNNNH